MKATELIVAGCRDYNDTVAIRATLDAYINYRQITPKK